MKRNFIIASFLFYFILIFNIFFISNVYAVTTQGFTVSSVSTSSIITKSTDPTTVYWIINTQFNGGGQAIAGTIDSDTVKNFMNGKVYTKQPLSIAVTSNDEQVFYEVTNEGIPIFHYKLQTFDAPQSCPLGICYIYDNPPPCPAGTNWDIPLGKSLFQYAKKRYCITKEQVGVKGVYNNPLIGFNAKIRLTVGSIFKEKTICSGATSGCDGSSVSFDDVAVATWSGSLITGESPPNQDNFVAIKKLASNRWQISRKSTYESYFPKTDDADQKLNTVKNILEGTSDIAKGDTEINNAISPVNQASDTLLNEDTSFTSSPFTKDDNTGKVTVTLKRSLTSPNVVFRIRADWIGIVIPTGQPKILSVTANKFGSGETGTINVQIQNIGEATGTFSAMLQNCEPFIQSTTAQSSRKTLQSQDIDTIIIYVSGGALSEDISKTCSVKVYDVNEPSTEISSNVMLTMEKAKVCVPNKMFADGNIIKRCNTDGTATEIVEECKYGIISDGKGGWKCASAPTPQTCPEGQVISKDTSQCVDPSQLIGYPADSSCQSGWPSHQGSMVSINEQNNACDLFEVKNLQLLSIAQETADCFSKKCLSNKCNIFCVVAYTQSGATYIKDSDVFKKFAGLYLIYGLGPASKFMQGYFDAEIECGSGTGTCEPKYGYNSYVQQLQCKGPVGHPEGWASDSDMSQNSCLFSDLPAHANVNILQTGTCVDYSISLTTLLRYAGYSNNEVYSVTAPCHEYNLVKFPGDVMWTIVDTVGNAPAPLGDTWSWDCGGHTTHCDFYENSCSNDNGQITCPSKSEVKGC